MKKQFATTIEKELIDKLKIAAINENVNANEILEKLLEMYFNGEIKIKLK